MGLIHGNSSIELIDSTVFITLKGAFNEFGVQIWFEKLKLIVKQLNGKPFSILINYLEADGATPEAFQVANKYNSWLCEQNLTAKAIVASTLLAAIDLSQISEQNRVNQKYKYFTTVPSAIEWLENQK
jgi:hypothetical protein